MIIFFSIWGAWIVFNLLVVTLMHRQIFINNDQMIASASGLFWNRTIILSPGLGLVLTPDEAKAILLHEEAHHNLHHIWENFVVASLLPFLLPFRRRRRQMQEFEADAYAAAVVGPATMASAISKLSSAQFDRIRVMQLKYHFEGRDSSFNRNVGPVE